MLIKSSNFFKKALRLSYREGQISPDRTDPPSFDLPEDGIDVMFRLCSIMHSNYDLDKDKVICHREALDLAQKADYYGFIDPVRNVIDRLKPPKGSCAHWDDRTNRTIAYFLDDERSFATASGLFITQVGALTYDPTESKFLTSPC